MAETNEKILDTISNMTVMEVVDLISEMEEKFGVKAAAAVAAAPAAAPAAASVSEEKKSWTLKIISFFVFVKLILHVSVAWPLR